MLAEKEPTLYKLIDLLKDPVQGHYYKEELVKCDAPNYEKDVFFIEKILHKKTVKKQTYFLVKYLFYPNKFNEWIPEENLIVSKDLQK